MAQPSLPELSAFLAERLPEDLAGIIDAFAGASATLRDSIESAPILGLLGKTGETNVQDEATAKLDDIANEIFTDALSLPQVRTTIGATTNPQHLAAYIRAAEEFQPLEADLVSEITALRKAN